jgi:hypothetical protein
MRTSIALFFVSVVVVGACTVEPHRNRRDDGDTTGSTMITVGNGGNTSAGGASNSGSTGGSTNTVTSTNASTNATNAASTSNGTTVANTAVASSSSGMNCVTDPMCPDCFCAQYPTGCNDYINAVIANIYCGQTCATSCSAFCASMDPIDITTTCDTCSANPSTTDINNFQTQCQASTDCVNFATQLNMCP